MKKVFILFVFSLLAGIPLSILSQTEVIDVNLVSDGNILNAQIYLPDSKKTSHTVIMLHGYPGGEGDPLGLGKALSNLGINVLVFNYQGTWSSEGEFSFESSMNDVSSALSFLKENENIQRFNIDTSKIIVGGYSFGGAMALTEAIYNPEIKRIISIGGADESVFGNKMLSDARFRSTFEDMLKKTEYPEGPVKVDIDIQSEHWLSNLDRYNQVRHAESLMNRDILFIFGWDDLDVIPEEHVLPLFRKLQSLNAKNIRIESFMTDHSFRNVREEMTQVIFKWIIDE
jgi:dipeptidyl aminopeptidase/acylaminoacyl peptidase